MSLILLNNSTHRSMYGDFRFERTIQGIVVPFDIALGWQTISNFKFQIVLLIIAHPRAESEQSIRFGIGRYYLEYGFDQSGLSRSRRRIINDD